jgi:hypothetical protein
MKAKIADALTITFLALTVSHCQHIISKFESAEWLSWGLAISLDVATAYSAFIATDRNVARMSKWFAIVWLLGLLSVGYGLNLAYYLEYKAGIWAWFLAAIFPVSLSLLGAIKSGLITSAYNSPVEPTPAIAEPLPTSTEPIAESPADSGSNSQQWQEWPEHVAGQITTPVEPVVVTIAGVDKETVEKAKRLARQLRDKKVSAGDFDKALEELLQTPVGVEE